jgi:hypothetical protein
MNESRTGASAGTQPNTAKRTVTGGAKNGYISLLQVVGTLAIIAFHAGFRGTALGWTAVVLFFALAGFNMAGAARRSDTVFEYGYARVRRLGFPLAIVWTLVLLAALSRRDTAGGTWFLLTAPAFLQNLTLPLFHYQMPQDYSFAPLWFVGALLQLQLIVFALRKSLLKWRPWLVAGSVAIVGMALRAIAANVFGGSTGEVDARAGGILYCLPLCHIEAITLGFLVGNGRLAGLGRQLPVLAVVTIGAGLISAALSGERLPIASLGWSFPLQTNYMHLWGYALLACTAAALCSPDNPVAVRLRTMAVPAWLDVQLSGLASLTYGAYVYHGLVLTAPLNPYPWLEHRHVPFAGLIAFVVLVVASFSLAGLSIALSRRIVAGVTTRRYLEGQAHNYVRAGALRSNPNRACSVD